MKSLGIRAKLTLTILCLSLLVAVVTSIGSARFYEKQLKTAITKQNFAMLTLAADQLDNEIASDKALIEMTGARFTPDLLKYPEIIPNYLRSSSEVLRTFDGGFIILDSKGRIITEYPEQPSRVGKDMNFRDYVSQTLKTGKVFISAPYKSGLPPHQPVITIAAPLKTRNGEIFGIIAGRHNLLDSNHLSRFSRLKVGTTGYLYIIHKNRTILMHPNKERILEYVKPGMNKALEEAFSGAEATRENVNSKGSAGLTSFKQLKNAPWIVASHFPLEEAYAQIDEARWRFTVIAILLSVMMSVVVLLISGRITSPLLAFVNHVRNLPDLSGEDRLTQIERTDEIGLLAKEFNKMITRLGEQEEFIRELLECTSTSMFVIDRDHKVLFWNRALEEMTGVKKESVVGTDRHSLAFYEEKRPTMADLVLNRADKSELYSHYSEFSSEIGNDGRYRAERWFDNLNGMKKFIYFEASPVKDQNGSVVAVLETLIDITNRKSAEESMMLFSEAVEQSASAIVITDTDGTIRYVNSAFCKVSGYSKEEAIGENPRVLKSGRQSREVYEELWNTIKAGEQWHGEFQNKRKDGTYYWELVTISPIFSNKGDITHFLAIKDDITARKEMEYKLRKQQAELIVKHEELNAIFMQVEKAKKEWEETMDCISDILILADSQNRIRRCNRALLDFVGISYKEIMNRDWREFFAAQFLDDAELGGDDSGSIDIFHEKSGRWFSVNIYPYQADKGLVITLHDLTEIKKVSNELNDAYTQLKSTHMQLLQQEKMASIGQLAAGVAHEINNPMGFISSNLTTLGKYTERLSQFIDSQAGNLNQAAAEEIASKRKALKIDYVLGDIPKLLSESADGAERVRKIVQNLKSFSRVDEAEKQRVNLNDCLDSTLSIAWNEIKYKSTVEKEYSEIPLLLCHPQQLNQVFLNLLVNAAHAIEKEGVIRIKTWSDDKSIFVSVSDNGSGIPEKIRNRIFEPFFTTKEPGKGTGLGLSISYDIVKKHGGEIQVESEQGKGTQFIVSIPLEGDNA